jgi:uncharacterized PurR-regulated membrane protein YhhQ (DUF165 family)
MYAVYFSPQSYDSFIFEVTHFDVGGEFVIKINILKRDICVKCISYVITMLFAFKVNYGCHQFYR